MADPVIVPGSPEHDAAMIKAAEEGGVRIRVTDGEGQTAEVAASELKEAAPVQATADIKQRPDNVPEKFWNKEKGEVNVEALLKSNADAQIELTRRAQAPAQQQTPAAPVKSDAQKAAEAELAAATTDEAKAAAQTKLDAANTAAKAVADAAAAETAKTANVTQARAEATAELQRDGKISDATYAKLEQAGFDRETVDNYVAGEKARAEVVELKVYNEAGSKEEYAKMVQWAAANWSPEQVTAFNAALEKNDLTATLGAVKSLKSAYTEASGTDATVRVSGGGNNVVTGDMFRSKQEVNAAMSDKRYTSGDKAFHAEVDRKLEASIKANIDLGF